MTKLKCAVYVTMWLAIALSAPCAHGAPMLTEDGWAGIAASDKLYIEMPVKGIIGVDVIAESFEITLSAAAADPNVQIVLFTINSDGGMVLEAERIRDVMLRHRRDLTYIAVVERAISAAIWVVFGCQQIYVCDDATLGGAVVYAQNMTGNVDVDAKFNSIITAGIRNLAQSNQHPPQIVSAMMMRQASVYAWSQRGKVQIASHRPAGVRELLLEDGPSSVLTLTDRQAISVNLAKPAGRDGASLMTDFESRDGWMRASGLGNASIEMGYYQRNVQAAKQFFDQLTHRFKEASATYQQLDQLEKDVQSAIAADPERMVHVRQGDGDGEVMIVQSQMEFADSLSKARRAWSRVQSRGRRVRAGIIAFLKRIQRSYRVDPTKEDVATAFHFEEKAQEQLKRLSAIRFSQQ